MGSIIINEKISSKRENIEQTSKRANEHFKQTSSSAAAQAAAQAAAVVVAASRQQAAGAAATHTHTYTHAHACSFVGPSVSHCQPLSQPVRRHNAHIHTTSTTRHGAEHVHTHACPRESACSYACSCVTSLALRRPAWSEPENEQWASERASSSKQLNATLCRCARIANELAALRWMQSTLRGEIAPSAAAVVHRGASTLSLSLPSSGPAIE